MATNGVYIVMGEANCVVALLNKARRQYQLSHQAPTLEDTDPLLRNFTDLKEVLNEVTDLADMNPLTYLSPFLDVIKAQNTNGPITEAALSAVAKFLNYGLIDANSLKAANAVESISYAVVHTKFIGGKSTGSDECVLFKILQVLRSLLLSPPGILLSNEAVCDLMQSCFRIVFEQNLSLLLRKAAESTLSDMTQLIFTRLPTFAEDIRHPYLRQLVNTNEKRQKRKKKIKNLGKMNEKSEENDEGEDEEELDEKAKMITSEADVTKLGFDVVSTGPSIDNSSDKKVEKPRKEGGDDGNSEGDEADSESESGEKKVRGEGKNQATVGGLQREIISDDEDPLMTNVLATEEQLPYGLPCCRELLRFLIAMINPLDRHNTESMVVLGLHLLIVALEAVADHLPTYEFLMPLIKNNLCRSLLQLLDTEKLPVLAATNRCCFLLFESMRMHLKFQLEAYLKKLQTIVLSEKNPTNNGTEQKEMALESLVQLWRIPGLVTEMYLNYDCDLYCSNVFQDLTKLLVENSFPTMGGHTASLLSLDALLVVIETIEKNCEDRENGREMMHWKKEAGNELKKLELPILSGYEIGKKIKETNQEQNRNVEKTGSELIFRSNRHAPSENLPSMSEIIEQKKRKRLIAEGTQLFNQSPKKGIEFLREKGILGHDAASLVNWLRTNPQLDKKSIADYICSRKNAEVLEAFVKSFPFEGARLDTALRMFLETFRLPGESAEISMVMQYFSDEWFKANGEPFNHVDAAFTLSYAIIMLNVDQHNPTAKRNQPPMTIDCFKRNLSGTNGGQDFDSEMLVEMYNAIKSEEIVMPAEQKGNVKEDYLWKVLLRRGETSEGQFYHAPTGWNDNDLFAVCWGPAVSALSYVFDKSENEHILQKALTGYRKCAKIAAYYGMKEVFDNLCIHLCKFTTLTSMRESGSDDNIEAQRQKSINDANISSGGSLNSPEDVVLSFGENHKAQLATKTLFYLVHENGNILREGWRNLFEVLLQMFRIRLLPSDMTEVEDFVDEKGWVSIQRIHQRELTPAKSETGLLSWLGLGGGANETDKRKPTQEQLSSMKLASSVIIDCKPSQIISDSKYLTSTSLAEMLTAIKANSLGIVQNWQENKKSLNISGEDEDSLIFYLEIIISITLENKDRLPILWPHVRAHLEWLLNARFGNCRVLVERAVVGLLRVANRNLFRDNMISDDVLQSLSLLLKLSPQASFIYSRQIAYGLYELIRANAANVHKKEHWAVLFELLELAGAAVVSDDVTMTSEPTVKFSHERNAFSDVEQSSVANLDDRAYTSEGEEAKRRKSVYDSQTDIGSGVESTMSLIGDRRGAPTQTDWIHLDHKDAAKATAEALKALGPSTRRHQTFQRGGSLVLRTGLGRHEPAAFLKVCECLAFLLRDAIHVTPDNFESSIQCLRTMVEASFDGGCYAAGPLSGDAQNRLKSSTTEERTKRHHHHHHHQRSTKKDLSTDVAPEEISESRSEEQQLTANYQQTSLHLLDLCSQLHARVPEIFAKWSENVEEADEKPMTSVSSVWINVWKPLLQAIARLSCDCRRLVRGAALSHLQRAFLPANMSSLGSEEWESCFGEVLFPLLTKLTEPFSQMDPIGMEDTRVRTIQIVAKTLLNHLSVLSVLPSFPTLWLRLLDYMEQYLKVDSCGNLNEAVPESLKNMLLVMDNTQLFSTIPGLYQMTIDRLQTFLPQLIRDTIPNPPESEKLDSLKKLAHVQISTPAPPSTTEKTPVSSEVPKARSTTPVPLTEVVVNSGPTSPIGSPPAESSSSNVEISQQQHQHQQQQAASPQYYQDPIQVQYNQYQNYPQYQQQYQYSINNPVYYDQQMYQQYQHQQHQQHEIYANQYHHQFNNQAPTSSISTPVHGQHSVVNPLPIITQTPSMSAIQQQQPHQSHHQQYQQPIVSPSANSAFSQVYTNQNSTTSSAQLGHQPAQAQPSGESPYFTPIPYNPSNPQQ